MPSSPNRSGHANAATRCAGVGSPSTRSAPRRTDPGEVELVGARRPAGPPGSPRTRRPAPRQLDVQRGQELLCGRGRLGVAALRPARDRAAGRARSVSVRPARRSTRSAGASGPGAPGRRRPRPPRPPAAQCATAALEGRVVEEDEGLVDSPSVSAPGQGSRLGRPVVAPTRRTLRAQHHRGVLAQRASAARRRSARPAPESRPARVAARTVRCSSA